MLRSTFIIYRILVFILILILVIVIVGVAVPVIALARCFGQGTASLVLEGKDNMISLTGQQEAPWRDVIIFHGDTINSRFVAETDGHRVGDSAMAGDPEQDNWGFRFTVRIALKIDVCRKLHKNVCC